MYAIMATDKKGKRKFVQTKNDPTANSKWKMTMSTSSAMTFKDKNEAEEAKKHITGLPGLSIYPFTEESYYLSKEDTYAKFNNEHLTAPSHTKNKNMAHIFPCRLEAEIVVEQMCHKLKGFKPQKTDNNPLEVQTVPKQTGSTSTTKRKSFTMEERKQIYRKYKGTCNICGRFLLFDEMTIDHIVPLSKGGTNEMSNLQCSCLTCNRIKMDILPEDFMKKVNEIFKYQHKEQIKVLRERVNRIQKGSRARRSLLGRFARKEVR